MAHINSAPLYNIASNHIVAVEHPMIIKNIDNGLKTFGNGAAFSRIIRAESVEGCVPLYLRYNDLMCNPILSRNVPTSNVLLKVTVPRRTGLKRKRGSDTPFTGHYTASPHDDGRIRQSDILQSQCRQDDPAKLMRSLEDNIGRYNVEAVATIEQTHRYRGLTDFHHSTVHTEFIPKMRAVMASKDVASVKRFKFDPSMGWKKNEEILPPPTFAIQALPANWCWEQNVQGDENEDLAPKFKRDQYQVDYLAGDAELFPESCRYGAPSDPNVQSFVEELRLVFDERPIWTRRALINRVSNHPDYDNLFMKTSLKYVCFQIRSGPYRDCLVQFGVDPRRDAKYHIYQSIFFRALDEQDYSGNDSLGNEQGNANPNSHIFDGKTLFLDMKTWQLCDIRDPILVDLIKAPLRDSFDPYSGYYHNGAWAKIRSIMRIKLHGLLYNIPVTDKHLETTMKVPDIMENVREGKIIHIPLPDFDLTEEQIAAREAGGPNVKKIRSRVNPGGKRKNRSERAGRLKENFRRMEPFRPRRQRKSTKKEDKQPNSDVDLQLLERPLVENTTAETGNNENRETSNNIDQKLLNNTHANVGVEDDVSGTPGIDEESDEADDSDMDGINFEDYANGLGGEYGWESQDDGSEEFGEGGEDEEIGEDSDSNGTDVADFIQKYTANDEWG